MIAVRFFSTSANYAAGDFVVQAGGIWVANTSITAGAFNPSQWRELAYLTDIPAIYVLPIASTSVLGGVKVDGVTVQADANGVLSSAGLVSVSATAPSPVQNGALWYDLVGGQLYTWVNDGTSSQWVIAVNQNLAGGVWLPLTGGALSGAISGPMATFANLSAPQAIGDNRIINGDMRIDQRNNGASGTAIGVYTVDRWFHGSGVAGKLTWGRGGPSAQPTGFPYWLGVTTTTAYTAAAADIFNVVQRIEADMISDFAFGTANAQPITLSFWAAHFFAGAFSGSISNDAGTRSYPFTYSIPTANTWVKIVVTIPGDTGGTWVSGGNGLAMYVRFDLGSGANSRGPAGAWSSSNFIGVTGTIGLVATQGGICNFTGVKLEIGSVATPFNRQSLAKSMADCERYFRWLPFNMQQSAPSAGSVMQVPLSFSAMRAAPTISLIQADPNTTQANVNNSVNTISPQSPYSAVVSIQATAIGSCAVNGYRCSASAEL